jgi:opacity protein-like surface antigen
MRVFGLSPGLVLLCGIQFAPSASAQWANPEGLYGWYEAGAAFVDKATLRDFPGEVTENNAVKFDPGFHFGIAIGHEVTRYLSLEVESGFNYNALSSIAGADKSSANVYRVPIMGNVVLKYPNRTGFVPIIGAGAGAHWSVFDAQNVSFGATTLSDDEETWTFGYQGYAGVCYKFQENMSLGVFYHYSVVDGPSWDYGSAGGNFKLDSLRTHSVALTLGWYF